MGIFNWKKTKDSNQTASKTQRQPPRPAPRDMTGGFTVNDALTQGLYHNTYQGLKLAGGMAFSPIALPVFFMGFPVVRVENAEAFPDLADDILRRFMSQMQQLHTECHRDGTVWVWPRWDKDEEAVVWEFIPDSSVSDVVRSIDTGRILAVYTDETITVSTGREKTETVRRQRSWTPRRYTDKYTGGASFVPEPIDAANRTGIMPIPFANNRGSYEVRGHSDYERIVPLLAAYHQIAQNEYETLAMFRAKMVQSGIKGETGLATWKLNNGIATLSEYDPATVDLILNVDDEKTEFIFADGATADHREAKSQIFHQIVQASGVPEILWGLKTTGNHASAEENMATLAQFVQDKQRQKNDSYTRLFQATLALDLAAAMSSAQTGKVRVEWNALDSLSEKTRGEIFLNFARGLSELTKSAVISREQQFKLWETMYPDATSEDFDKWKLGTNETAAQNQFNAASWTETAGLKQ